LEKGASTRTAPLPAGEVFYGLTTTRRHEGGTTHVEPVGRESIPLYVRGGGIIPLAVDQPTRLDRDETEVLRLLCAPDRDGSFVLYEDDGRTRAHERGERRETRITMTAGSTVHLGLERHGSYRSAVRTLLLDVINPDRAPLRVLVDGVAIARLEDPAPLEDPAQLRDGVTGWGYDAGLGAVRIAVPDTGADLAGGVSFGPLDMIGMGGHDQFIALPAPRAPSAAGRTAGTRGRLFGPRHEQPQRRRRSRRAPRPPPGAQPERHPPHVHRHRRLRRSGGRAQPGPDPRRHLRQRSAGLGDRRPRSARAGHRGHHPRGQPRPGQLPRRLPRLRPAVRVRLGGADASGDGLRGDDGLLPLHAGARLRGTDPLHLGGT